MELSYGLFVNLNFDELENILISPNPKAEIKKKLEEQEQKQKQQVIIKQQ